MSRKNTKIQEAKEIIASIIDVDSKDLADQSKCVSFEKWDSLATLNIILAFEGFFNISIPLETLEYAEEVNDFLLLVPDE